MTGTHTQNPIYSRITMALMEDTGWYLPNYNMADDFKWGRKLGCDFALRSCLEWMETRQKKGQSFLGFFFDILFRDFIILFIYFYECTCRSKYSPILQQSQKGSS